MEVSRSNFSNITKTLRLIEIAKIQTYARLVKNDLIKYPNCKIAVFLSYTSPLQQLTDILKEYRPLVLDGKTPNSKRIDNISKYQEFNLNYRLLIANISVASVGLNFDDRSVNGMFPRRVYASPNYDILTLFQSPGRFLRATTTSNVVFRFVYGKSAPEEEKILDSLSRKTQVMKTILDVNVVNGVLCPGDYPSVYEKSVIVTPDPSPGLGSQVRYLSQDLDTTLNIALLDLNHDRETKYNPVSKTGVYPFDYPKLPQNHSNVVTVTSSVQ
jgi:hypothetical protein